MTIQKIDETTQRADTRSAVRDLLLAGGVVTAAEIAAELGLTAAGVRRHLEHLESSGEIEQVRKPPTGGRGRPAKAFRLTNAGRAPLEHEYDTLAEQALRALLEVGGPQALEAFARERVTAVIGHVRPALDADDVPRAAREITEALTAAGYAASLEDAGPGMQICQHHCPIWNVASHFPQLCTAEQQVVSEILGSHVQRLSTIAAGGCACTTNIPTGTVATPRELAATIPAPQHPAQAGSSSERTTR